LPVGSVAERLGIRQPQHPSIFEHWLTRVC
jgi:hypothetical protein